VRPLACVIGTIDLVRPLGLAGIRCAVAAPPESIARRSRFATATIEWADPWAEPERLLANLVAFGAVQPERPVLFYEGDWDLLLVSRHRDVLSRHFRFVVPEPELVEDLLDKSRFSELARRHGLPVPPSVRIARGMTDIPLSFPVLVKPLTRQTATWEPVSHGAKALCVAGPEQLQALTAPRPGAAEQVELLAQQLIAGPETSVESYHVYVDGDGETVAEFTGRKLRTRPALYGHSTALEITDRDDVRRLGRGIVEQLGLRGVAKLDFKRDAEGQLWLLEVNPRFNLWHHPAARAGVNVPALVYGDLVGLPRPAAVNARAGVRWVNRDEDYRAAAEAGIPLLRWLPWALGCEAKSGVALDDPMPLLYGCWRLLLQHLRPRPVEPAVAARWGVAILGRVPRRSIDFGQLRRLRPFSARYGFDRGLPVDRFYIERFLDRHCAAVRGEVLEVKDAGYTERFGRDRVAGSHVVDIDRRNRRATLVADLCVPGSLPTSAYDCVILTQTLQYLADADAAMTNVWASLRAGGDLLLSVPCLARLDPREPATDLCRRTPSGLAALLRRCCPDAREVVVEGHGNVLVSTAFAFGLAAEELTPIELEASDAGFPVVVCARATKPR
jgi:predicted ATP-grasp superfamily ATP-dependent carboligase